MSQRSIGESMSVRNTLLVCFMAAALASAFAVSLNAQGQATLNGRVTDVQGIALPRAEVSLVPVTPAMPGMKMTPPAPLPGRVNNDGTFVFNEVPAGDY